MRLLLDESLPRGLKAHLPGHEVTTVPEQGWAGLSNGDLLRRAEHKFDVFVTADQNLEYQQHLSGFDIGVVVLCAVRTRLDDLLPLVPKTLHTLADVGPGQVKRITL